MDALGPSVRAKLDDGGLAVGRDEADLAGGVLDSYAVAIGVLDALQAAGGVVGEALQERAGSDVASLDVARGLVEDVALDAVGGDDAAVVLEDRLAFEDIDVAPIRPRRTAEAPRTRRRPRVCRACGEGWMIATRCPSLGWVKRSPPPAWNHRRPALAARCVAGAEVGEGSVARRFVRGSFVGGFLAGRERAFDLGPQRGRPLRGRQLLHPLQERPSLRRLLLGAQHGVVNPTANRLRLGDPLGLEHHPPQGVDPCSALAEVGMLQGVVAVQEEPRFVRLPIAAAEQSTQEHQGDGAETERPARRRSSEDGG